MPRITSHHPCDNATNPRRRVWINMNGRACERVLSVLPIVQRAVIADGEARKRASASMASSSSSDKTRHGTRNNRDKDVTISINVE